MVPSLLADPAVADLPVAEVLPDLLRCLDGGRAAVLVAPPGAGKTTLVPLALLDAPWRGDGRVIVLEPRRLAARAAATRMAALLGEPVGRRVGFATRLERAVSAETRIEVVTEGLLVRRLIDDPGLDGVACVVLDEVHERALPADLALALCLDLRRMLRPELRLLAMSATPDGARLAALMDAEVIESAGRAHPVAVSHAGRDLPAGVDGLRALSEAVARAVRAALAAHPGDILAFLPGMAEIRRAASALDGCGAVVLPLHGDLPPAEQDRALRPLDNGGRRVVLATAIAETSLTVPGVRIVVDGGFRRAPRLDPATGLTRLVTTRISRAAAEQRAGRAGRLGPGVAIRLWTAAAHRGLPPFDRPEMLEAELSGLVLDCAAWGTAPEALGFPDAPPAGPLAAARALLIDLGALDGDGRITASGRRMAALGAHPRLAAMMLAADDAPSRATAADLAALIEERDPLRQVPTSDIGDRLAALAGAHAAADRATVARIRRAAEQFRRRLGVPPTLPAQADGASLGRLIAAAFPDRIAQARGEPGTFRLAGGGGASLPATDPMARRALLAVAVLDVARSPRIRMAAPLDPDRLPPALCARVTETAATGIDPASGRVLARRRLRLGALVLRDRTEPAAPSEAADALATAAAGRLPWSDAARDLQARVALMRGLEPDGWPDLSDATLDARAAELVRPWLDGATRLADLDALDLLAVLRAELGHARMVALDAALPPALTLPGGRAPIDYAAPVPIAAARAQAFYGLDRTPTLAGGRIALRLALLSPAGRPIAVVADLPGFWRGAWTDARRDMRGRYPRHDWPEDPSHAADRGRVRAITPGRA